MDLSTFHDDMTIDETAQWFKKKSSGSGGNIPFVVYSVPSFSPPLSSVDTLALYQMH